MPYQIEIINRIPEERKNYPTNINLSHIKECPHCGESHQVLPFFAAMWNNLDDEEQYYAFHEPIETVTGYWARKDEEFKGFLCNIILCIIRNEDCYYKNCFFNIAFDYIHFFHYVGQTIDHYVDLWILWLYKKSKFPKQY